MRRSGRTKGHSKRKYTYDSDDDLDAAPDESEKLVSAAVARRHTGMLCTTIHKELAHTHIQSAYRRRQKKKPTLPGIHKFLGVRFGDAVSQGNYTREWVRVCTPHIAPCWRIPRDATLSHSRLPFRRTWST